MIIESLSKNNASEIAKMMNELWPNSSLQEEMDYCHEIVLKDDVFCATCSKDNMHVGFVLVTIRTDWVEGAISTPVGYLEGIYVRKPFRREKFAGMLLEAAEQWIKSKGITQMGSDVEIPNHISHQFHLASGFREVNRIVCYMKSLG